MGDDRDDGSAVADRRLDTLAVADPDIAKDALAVCELSFTSPGSARSMATDAQTRDGIVLRWPLPGRAPLKVSRTPSGPLAEAVLPHP